MSINEFKCLACGFNTWNCPKYKECPACKSKNFDYDEDNDTGSGEPDGGEASDREEDS